MESYWKNQKILLKKDWTNQDKAVILVKNKVSLKISWVTSDKKAKNLSLMKWLNLIQMNNKIMKNKIDKKWSLSQNSLTLLLEMPKKISIKLSHQLPM